MVSFTFVKKINHFPLGGLYLYACRQQLLSSGGNSIFAQILGLSTFILLVSVESRKKYQYIDIIMLITTNSNIIVLFIVLSVLKLLNVF